MISGNAIFTISAIAIIFAASVAAVHYQDAIRKWFS